MMQEPIYRQRLMVTLKGEAIKAGEFLAKGASGLLGNG
jgi:hypothetical protein